MGNLPEVKGVGEVETSRGKEKEKREMNPCASRKIIKKNEEEEVLLPEGNHHPSSSGAHQKGIRLSDKDRQSGGGKEVK